MENCVRSEGALQSLVADFPPFSTVLFRGGMLDILNTFSKFRLRQIYQCLSILPLATLSLVYQGLNLYVMSLG